MTHRPAQLSGGEQQRTAVARALAVDPLVLLADEPSGNLDHCNSERLHELFAPLARELETAMVVVTHNRSLAARADRVLATGGRPSGAIAGVEVDALMLCDQCHEREAVVHLTQIENEQVTTLHLCEQCAAEKGVESAGRAAKTPLGDFLAAMGKGCRARAARNGGTTLRPTAARRCRTSARPAGWAAPTATGPSRRSCATCCAACTARPITWASVRRARPKSASRDRSRGELREQLRRAIETEHFELAADLRDRLRVLE